MTFKMAVACFSHPFLSHFDHHYVKSKAIFFPKELKYKDLSVNFWWCKTRNKAVFGNWEDFGNSLSICFILVGKISLKLSWEVFFVFLATCKWVIIQKFSRTTKARKFFRRNLKFEKSYKVQFFFDSVSLCINAII